MNDSRKTTLAVFMTFDSTMLLLNDTKRLYIYIRHQLGRGKKERKIQINIECITEVYLWMEDDDSVVK